MHKVEVVYSEVPLTVEVEFDAGEPAVRTGPSDCWHPGVRASAVLIRALAGGVDVTPLIRDAARVVIENEAAYALEAA